MTSDAGDGGGGDVVDVDPTLLDTDLYGVLGLDAGASAEEITRAYRRLARDLHPDTSRGASSADHFAALTTAYEVLRDPGRRAAYDRARRSRPRDPQRRPGGGYAIRVQHIDADRAAGGGGPGRRRAPFGRRGDDVTITVPVSYAEAVLGAEIAVPSPDGQPVRVRVPPGTASGTVLRVRDHGAPTPQGRGELLATAEVHVPRHLDARQQDLVLRLARLDEPGLRDHLWP
jgi:DnaJ-class molecular chaperone